jgi:hypothetical protein
VRAGARCRKFRNRLVALDGRGPLGGRTFGSLGVVGDWIATSEVARSHKLPTDAKSADMRLQRRLIAVGCSVLAMPTRAPRSSRVPASSSYRCAVLVLISASASASVLVFPLVAHPAESAVSSSADTARSVDVCAGKLCPLARISA